MSIPKMKDRIVELASERDVLMKDRKEVNDLLIVAANSLSAIKRAVEDAYQQHRCVASPGQPCVCCDLHALVEEHTRIPS